MRSLPQEIDSVTWRHCHTEFLLLFTYTYSTSRETFSLITDDYLCPNTNQDNKVTQHFSLLLRSGRSLCLLIFDAERLTVKVDFFTFDGDVLLRVICYDGRWKQTFCATQYGETWRNRPSGSFTVLHTW